MINSQLYKIIHILKTLNNIISHQEYYSILDKLNQIIVKRNQKTKIGQHGIILQLSKPCQYDKQGIFYINDILHLYSVECKECKHIMEVGGSQIQDIFAPCQCDKCNSYNMIRTNEYKCKCDKCQSKTKKILTNWAQTSHKTG